MPLFNNLSEEENKYFERIADLYSKAKSLIVYSEEIDPNSKINPQIWKELRDAFDHIMRICIDILKGGQRKCDNAIYYCQNLDKAHGHVFRAAFDALDGASISIKKKIIDVVNGYDREVLVEVIPNYWKRRNHLEKINTQILLIQLNFLQAF